MRKVLVIVALLLILANYGSGTILSGWDTLHPEFNFPLYFQRIIFGVWQGTYGLGAVSAQAHAAEIPRMLFYFPLSFVLPADFLRYAGIFAALIIGPLGIYEFVGGMGEERDLRPSFAKAVEGKDLKLAGFLAGLFYLLNLGTLQHFVFPLEMFATGYAAIPWLFYLGATYFKTGRKKTLAVFALVTFLAAPMAHTPTLWFAYLLELTIFVGGLALTVDRQGRKRGAVLLSLTVLVNTFWLLPSLYFIANHGSEVVNSQISRQFSPLAIAVGKEFGNIPDTLTLKNYYFDWERYDTKSNGFVPVLGAWLGHLDSFPVKAIQGLLLGVMGLGALRALGDLRKKETAALIPVLLVAFFFVADNIWGVGAIWEKLAANWPMFQEALRFPFTKFSLFIMLGEAVFFGIGAEKLKKRLGELGVLAVMGGALIILMWPAFTGNLINPGERVAIPGEYFSLFNYLNSQPSGRVAYFPVNTLWGWNYYRWGYEGAGFLWFGLNDPLLNREFDRWNKLNEQSYQELSQAVYAKNPAAFKTVLTKYQIRYLVVDGNVVDPSAPKSLFFPETEDLFARTGTIKEIRDIGDIKIYENQNAGPVAFQVSATKTAEQPAVRYSGFSARTEEIVSADGENASSKLYLPNLPQKDSYLVTAETQNLSGQPFLFWAENLQTDRADMRAYLPGGSATVRSSFVIPPGAFDGRGYYFHFDNPKLGREVAQNKLLGAKVYRISLSSVPEVVLQGPSLQVEHPNPTEYDVAAGKGFAGVGGDEGNPETIVLGEAYEPGWQAFFVDSQTPGWLAPFLGQKLTSHRIINGWENGWTVTNGEWPMNHEHDVIKILFLPQYLEFLGMFLTGTVLLFVFIVYGKNRNY